MTAPDLQGCKEYNKFRADSKACEACTFSCYCEAGAAGLRAGGLRGEGRVSSSLTPSRWMFGIGIEIIGALMSPHRAAWL